MIKKMMRLKKKQDSVPESEKLKHFIPKNVPEFMSDGRDKYYFDIKNNKEHYHMMTNDMTDEDYAVFEEREQARIDQLHHTKKLMAMLVEKRLEQYRLAKLEREASKNKKIEIDKLGEYRSKKNMLEEDYPFRDDDDLLLLQVQMDTSDRKEMIDAIKAHVSKHSNRKFMLCP